MRITTLPRRIFDDIPETVILRPEEPDDHREFERLLPWLTPLFVYANDGMDWVRWSAPPAIAQDMGLDAGCVCCGRDTSVKDEGGAHVDTTWPETGWWLTANGYALPHPTKGTTTS